jgi:PAS domain S-box-containing protein
MVAITAAAGEPSRFPLATMPIERVIPVAFGVAMIAIAAAAALLWQSLTQYRESARLVTHTYAVLQTVESVFSALNEATAYVREYVITHDRALLEQRDAAIGRLNEQVAELANLTADNPVQVQRAQAIEKLVTSRVYVMNALQALSDDQGIEAARRFIMDGSARALTSRIRATLNDMDSTERTLLSSRAEADRKSGQRLMLSAAGLLALVIITILFAFLRIQRELATRRVLSAELEESRKFFQTVFENMPNMVFIKDARDLRYIAFNTAAELMANVSRDKVIGKTDFDLFPIEQAEALVQNEREIIENRVTVDIPQERLRIRAHDERIMHTRKTVITAADGTPLYLLGISEDVTQRAESERRIQNLNDELKLHSQALEAVNKELESFCYSVSHDLRAPLRAVNSYALMLEEDYAPQLNDEAKRFIRTIRDGANRMGRLIEDLLAFSRLGRTQLKSERLDASAAVARAVREVMESHEGKPPELAVHELPPAHGDPALMHQVWTNLIGNAVKYSSRVSMPRVEIGGCTNGAEVVYYVKDNGAGFDMRYIHKLFGVFQRLHGQEEFPGTGVGLAIVHRVITRHGGRVWAESEPGKGATFSFTLPKGDAA